KGREVKEQLLEQAAEVYAEVKEQLVNSKKIKELSQHEYIKKVQEVVDMYAVKNGLAERVKSLLVKVVSAQWKNIQKEMKK
ncbi:hypothetical protein KKG82_02535, partial [Patescibacteria group bacterium]|nr:hypothetical protein [Patescibacteria group bacterium]